MTPVSITSLGLPVMGDIVVQGRQQFTQELMLILIGLNQRFGLTNQTLMRLVESEKSFSEVLEPKRGR